MKKKPFVTKEQIEEIAKTLQEEGVDTEIFQIGAEPLRDCIGCGGCSKGNGCVFRDDCVNEFVEKAKEADGFIHLINSGACCLDACGEVKDADGSQLGIFYVDYFPRSGKSGGAWMSNYREQQGATRPLVCNVCSFTKPVGDTPSLLTMDEVETLFHEFGHALHGLLTKCEYKGTSGTNVVRDFVELPSQINEHWATEPEVLKMYAKHYQTGEVIPDEIIEKILKQKTFNQGFMTTELLAAAILDMNLHMITDVKNLDMLAFEKEAMDELGLIPEIAPRYRVTYFNHIIGGYAAGYYSYLWANVLDNDAFEAFKEHGIFDKNTADLFRYNVLEKGDSEDPMILYKNFRGAEPSLEPLLKNRGMK